MLRDCPNCRKPVNVPDNLVSGWYVCPYDVCSKTFFLDRNLSTLHKIDQSAHEILEDGIIVTCPNRNCMAKVKIQKVTGVHSFTCPKCQILFGYEVRDKKIHHDISGLLAEFDQALEDEMKALKTRGGNIILLLSDGKLIGEIAREGVYQFDLERKIPVVDETPAKIEIMGGNYRAAIVRFLDFKLEIRITGFDSERIPSARLTVDATYVLTKLKVALSSLRSKSKTLDLTLKTFNLIPPKCAVGIPIFPLVDKNGNGPDFYQGTAAEMCLGNEVSFVHGPPGTGKTRTLVNVVNELANSGKRILVSCHTNIACDNVMKQFLEYDHHKTVENLLSNGELVRIGTPVLNDKKIKALTVDEIYQNLSKELLTEKRKLTDLVNSLVERNKEYYEYKQILLECEKAKKRLASCEQSILAGKDAIGRYIQEENELALIVSAKTRVLNIAEKRNAIVNFLRGTNPERLRATIISLNNAKTEKMRSRLDMEKRLGLLLDEIERLNISVSGKLSTLPEGADARQIETALEQTDSSLDETRIRLANIEDRISRLNEGVLSNAKVIVSTLAKTFTDPILINMQFDAVVIDEASIAPLPMLFYVCSLAKEKVLIFGDPKQLAPIASSNTSLAERWLKTDIFREANATTASPNDPRTQSLQNQYRMHREIFEIVNVNFYGQLHDMKPIDQEHNRYDNLIPMNEHRVVIIDTSKAKCQMSVERTGPRSSSRYNLYHIQILEKVLHDLIDGKFVKQDEVGIITPYKSQNSFIRETLQESGHKEIDFGTVHSFQGIEKNYIIFDLVEAPGGGKIGVLVNDKHEKYLDKNDIENDAMRLLTVGFSRPREKLLIISHNQHMLGSLPGNSVIRKIIADLTDHEAIVDGSELVPYYIPRDEYPDVSLISAEELLKTEAVFNQKSFYPHLIRDLKDAKKEVIFISGYMTTNRIERLMPYLTDLLSRGVSIKIFTKPPREQMSKQQELEQLHHRLKNVGVEIYQYYGTHEKVVALDGHILYAGSLNVLSFSHGSSEMMIRSDSRPKLRKVFSVLAKQHPKLADYLTETEYMIPDEVVDLTPERFQDVLDAVRPKNRELPKTQKEAIEYCRSMLKKLRWVIADDKRIPYMAVLHNSTIEAMLNNPPVSVEELLSLPEFTTNRTNIKGYENIALKTLEILKLK